MSTSKQQPNLHIQKLLDAEEEADKIVKRARENRIRKLKEAKKAAEEELEIFKKKEEDTFNKEYKAAFGGDDSFGETLVENTKKELENVKQDFKANKEKVIDVLTKHTVKTSDQIPEVQRRALKRAANTL